LDCWGEVFYRPDALPVTQLTVTKQRRNKRCYGNDNDDQLRKGTGYQEGHLASKKLGVGLVVTV